MLTRLIFSDSRRFSSDWPAHVDAHNSATHACYWLWAYTPSIDLVVEAPWLVAFIKKTLEFWLGEAAKRDRGENGNGSDGLVYADLDAIAECTDVLRSVLVIGEAATGVHQKQVDAAASARGLSELPPLLERASAWLMGMQGTDGSWPHFPFPLHDPMRTRLVRLPSPTPSMNTRLHMTRCTPRGRRRWRYVIAAVRLLHRQHGGTASASVV